MLPNVGTWLLFRVDGEKKEESLAAITLSAETIKVRAVSQYIDLVDANGDVFATLTWPSTTQIRAMGLQRG